MCYTSKMIVRNEDKEIVSIQTTVHYGVTLGQIKALQV
jgi:hypothetical protein